MLILLSPAKSLNEDRAAGKATTVPRFLDQAEELSATMADWSETDIVDLMKVSPKIARLNMERVVHWSRQSGSAQAAGDMFDGDVYQTLETATLSEDTRAEANRRLRILSGLYGLLRPSDDVCAYRLEMGRKLPGHAAGSLYKFWNSKIAGALAADAQEIDADTVLNLASEEYAKSVDQAALNGLRFVSPRFEEDRKGVRKVISFSAKRARGAMARWVLENRIIVVGDLKEFNAGDYAFDVESSTELCPVFVRVAG